MAKITCDVIKDLLPLYVEECASEDTCLLIEEHLLHCLECQEELEKLKEPMILPMDTEQALVDKLKSKQRKQKIIRAAGLVFMMIVFAISVLMSGHFRDKNRENVDIFTEDFGEKVTEASIQMMSPGQQEYYTSNPKQIENAITVLKNITYKKIEKPIDFDADYQLKLNNDGATITIYIDGAIVSIDDSCYEMSRLIGENLFHSFKEQAVAYLPDPDINVKEIQEQEYKEAFAKSKGYTVGSESVVSDDGEYRFYEIVIKDDFYSDVNPIEERFFYAVKWGSSEKLVVESFRCYNADSGYEIDPESYITEVRDGAVYSEWGYNKIVLIGNHGASNSKENFRGNSFGYHIAFTWNPDTLAVAETQIQSK